MSEDEWDFPRWNSVSLNRKEISECLALVWCVLVLVARIPNFWCKRRFCEQRTFQSKLQPQSLSQFSHVSCHVENQVDTETPKAPKIYSFGWLTRLWGLTTRVSPGPQKRTRESSPLRRYVGRKNPSSWTDVCCCLCRERNCLTSFFFPEIEIRDSPRNDSKIKKRITFCPFFVGCVSVAEIQWRSLPYQVEAKQLDMLQTLSAFNKSLKTTTGVGTPWSQNFLEEISWRLRWNVKETNVSSFLWFALKMMKHLRHQCMKNMLKTERVQQGERQSTYICHAYIISCIYIYREYKPWRLFACVHFTLDASPEDLIRRRQARKKAAAKKRFSFSKMDEQLDCDESAVNCDVMDLSFFENNPEKDTGTSYDDIETRGTVPVGLFWGQS